jgi:tetratricopeptide (TPR) repeat protein
MLILLAVLTQSPCVDPTDPTTDTPQSRAALAATCRAVIKAHPQDTGAYLVLGYATMDKPAEALETYLAGLRVAPENFELLVNAGLTYRQVGRLEEALAALAHAARVDTTDADALVQAGLVAHRLNRYNQAVQLFRHALKRHQDGPTWGYMARSLRALGRDADAVRAWDRAEHLSPHGFIDEAGDRADYNDSRVKLGLAPVSP